VIIDTYADVLTNEQLDLLLDILLTRAEGRVIASLEQRDYYIRRRVSEPVLDAALMSEGVVRLVDAHGLPLTDIRVLVETHYLPRSVTDAGVLYYYGQSNTRRSFVLNADGEVRVPLIRGARVTVHIENGFSRQLTVPDAAEFDLLSFTSDADGYLSPRPPVAPQMRGDL